MRWIRWFFAGFLAVPLFHQILLALFNLAGWVARAPFSFEPTKPLGVPQVISLSFWGGVWGIVLGVILDRTRSSRAFWMTALIVGAIAPTLVAMLVVAPLKGQPIALDAKRLAIGLLVNGAWGLGTAALSKVARNGV